MRMALAAAVSIAGILAGCRSARVDRVEAVSGVMEVDSAALSVRMAAMERCVDRDISVRRLRVERSAAGDTVVTLTVVSGRSREGEERRDTTVTVAGMRSGATVCGESVEEHTSAPGVPWWVWVLAAGLAAAALRR